MNKKKILLHSCCAPCSVYVNTLISNNYSVTLYFYNPNIAPYEEYCKRLGELERYAKETELPLVIGDYDNEAWTSGIDRYKSLGEHSERCRVCFEIRLEEVFKRASDSGFDSVATTLTVSPHKDSEMINDTGIGLGEKFKIEYIKSDYKKNNGYQKSVELSKSYGFYRQGYCGCIYSKMEREMSFLNKKKSI